MNQKKSDNSVVPNLGRKAQGTTKTGRGGKAVTIIKDVLQLNLFDSVAENSKETADSGCSGQPVIQNLAGLKGSEETKSARHAITMEEVVSNSNLKEALRRVVANKGATGVDGESVLLVQSQAPQILPLLAQTLLSGDYIPGMIRRVWIPKPGGDKRGLGIPNVIDRWVQQALYQVLSPHYESQFHPSSHGFRPNKGCHTAIQEAKQNVEDGREWIVDIDLEKFFDLVHHERLMSTLKKDIQDPRILKLIHRYLKAKIVLPTGVVVANEAGVPQGGPLSPLLSNVVLNELDWELSSRGHKFVRYADDCNIYVHSERAGQRVMQSMSEFIAKRLRLKVNQAKSAVAKPGERHFLGFRVCCNEVTLEVDLLLSKRTEERIYARVKELTPRNWGRSMDQCIQGLNVYLRGWVEYFKVCDSRVVYVLNAIDAHIRRRLRAIQLQHWKSRRSILKRLIGLGVKPSSAWASIYGRRKSIWSMSHSIAVDKGLRNAYFAERGLLSLATRWHQLNAK